MTINAYRQLYTYETEDCVKFSAAMLASLAFLASAVSTHALQQRILPLPYNLTPESDVMKTKTNPRLK